MLADPSAQDALPPDPQMAHFSSFSPNVIPEELKVALPPRPCPCGNMPLPAQLTGKLCDGCLDSGSIPETWYRCLLNKQIIQGSI